MTQDNNTVYVKYREDFMDVGPCLTLFLNCRPEAILRVVLVDSPIDFEDIDGQDWCDIAILNVQDVFEEEAFKGKELAFWDMDY